MHGKNASDNERTALCPSACSFVWGGSAMRYNTFPQSTHPANFSKQAKYINNNNINNTNNNNINNNIPN